MVSHPILWVMTWLRTRPTQPSWELESCWFWSSREIMIHGNWKRWLGLGNLFCWMLWMLDFPNVFFLLTPIFRLAHVPTGIYKENTWPPQVQVLGDFSWADDSPFLIRNSPMWVPENQKKRFGGGLAFFFQFGGNHYWYLCNNRGWIWVSQDFQRKMSRLESCPPSKVWDLLKIQLILFVLLLHILFGYIPIS